MQQKTISLILNNDYKMVKLSGQIKSLRALCIGIVILKLIDC